MKEIKITPPDGYEIDTMNSSFDRIVFKEIKKELPKKWENIHLLHGYKVLEHTRLKLYSNNNTPHTSQYNGNVFYSKEQAEASIALAQLSQLREVYRQGWKPDWVDRNDEKWIIVQHYDELKLFRTPIIRHFLAFKNREIAEEFLNNFRDLIEKASPLLFN